MHRLFVIVHTYVALLGITPAINNGTFGALYHLLKPTVVQKLPKGS